MDKLKLDLKVDEFLWYLYNITAYKFSIANLMTCVVRQFTSKVFIILKFSFNLWVIKMGNVQQTVLSYVHVNVV